jgi:hypothetical protein
MIDFLVGKAEFLGVPQILAIQHRVNVTFGVLSFLNDLRVRKLLLLENILIEQSLFLELLELLQFLGFETFAACDRKPGLLLGVLFMCTWQCDCFLQESLVVCSLSCIVERGKSKFGIRQGHRVPRFRCGRRHKVLVRLILATRVIFIAEMMTELVPQLSLVLDCTVDALPDTARWCPLGLCF